MTRFFFCMLSWGFIFLALTGGPGSDAMWLISVVISLSVLASLIKFFCPKLKVAS